MPSMNPYKSCNCLQCRSVSSANKRRHKREAHRGFRRATKEALRKDVVEPFAVSTGYRA